MTESERINRKKQHKFKKTSKTFEKNITKRKINVFLIPKYGASGAAFATLITQGSVSAVQLIYCVYHFSLKITLLPILKFIGFGAFVWLLCYFVKGDSIWLFLGVSGASFIGMFIFGLIDFKQLKSILSSKGKEEITEG